MKQFCSILGLLAILILPSFLFAQNHEPQVGDTTYYKTLIPEEKQGLLKNVSMIANMRFALRNEFYDGEFTKTRFTMEQFRMEIRGQVHKNIYFRFRNRFTKTQDPQSMDNLSHSIDLAYVRFDVSKKFSITAGKMCADWGGFEFDANPIDIYEYSDIIEMADNFLTGVGVSYQVHKNHSFTLQALNSRTSSFEEIYGPQPNKVESKVPLAIVGNWRGSFFGGKFNTIWSYAIHTEAKNTFMNYVALGNQLRLGKFSVEYDFKWSNEDLDRTGIVSATIPDSLYAYAVQNTLYYSHWLQLSYRVSPLINLAFVGMIDYANWDSDADPEKTTNQIRTAYGFIPTVEFYPFKAYNLRFFVNYVGRIYEYSDYAFKRFGAQNYYTGRFSIGFVSPLGIL